MEESKRKQLEAQLKKMLEHLDQAEDKPKQPVAKKGTGNIIRRRKGEKDKRFSAKNS